jgi:hypothetical protein
LQLKKDSNNNNKSVEMPNSFAFRFEFRSYFFTTVDILQKAQWVEALQHNMEVWENSCMLQSKRLASEQSKKSGLSSILKTISHSLFKNSYL